MATDINATFQTQIVPLIQAVTNLIPDLLNLIVAVIPIVIVAAVVGALVIFIKNCLEKINFHF